MRYKNKASDGKNLKVINPWKAGDQDGAVP